MTVTPHQPAAVGFGLIVCLFVQAWGFLPAAAADPAGFRRLAPGVLTVIPPDRSIDDVLPRGDLIEITEGQAALAWTPKQAPANTTLVERGRHREYPRDIWCLEFAFKPPRLLDVDVPAGEERMRRKQVWYMVYRVKNVGGRRLLAGKDDAGEVDRSRRETEAFEKPVRFLPHFVLESLEPLSDDEGMSSFRGYLDRVVPSAMEEIRRREDAGQRFLDSAEMVATEIAPGEERWGVAVWEDIDPRIDFFSIYVRGLTNAIRWRKKPGVRLGPADLPGRGLEETLESLRLDFWRPGDDRGGGERQMSIGFAGMFERMALGGRLLAALGWPQATTTKPVAGLDRLGLAWSDLLEPDAGGGGDSLLPLAKVLAKAAEAREGGVGVAAVQELVGDLGVAAVEELVAAAAGPIDAEREPVRGAALEEIKLTPTEVGQKPFVSLSAIVRSLESQPDTAARRRAAAAVFGQAARRVEWLAKAVANARTLAVLRDIDADSQAIGSGDALSAFASVQVPIATQPDAESRRRVLQGLFGARGPDLYAAAVAVNEGIDHAWVFRYEK
jgi:hypothetical protein